jgi:hypothetical protein
MDFILVSTENHDDAYFASARELTDAVLQRAIDQLGENRGFSCLPAVSLTALSPPTAAVSGATIGALTVFRGGRIQWARASLESLAQDWRIPHVYTDTLSALRLLQSLRSGDVQAIERMPWVAGQVKLCPICGFDLSHLAWPTVVNTRPAETDGGCPPFEVPPYETCGGCETTFGVDWIGMTYGEMRNLWLARACPWWMSGEIPDHVRSDPAALAAFEALCRTLMRTPTDHPLSSAPLCG